MINYFKRSLLWSLHSEEEGKVPKLRFSLSYDAPWWSSLIPSMISRLLSCTKNFVIINAIERDILNLTIWNYYECLFTLLRLLLINTSTITTILMNQSYEMLAIISQLAFISWVSHKQAQSVRGPHMAVDICTINCCSLLILTNLYCSGNPRVNGRKNKSRFQNH